MNDTPSKWADLSPRVLSAVVMSAVGLGAIWVGGVLFGLLVALAVGAVLWEIARMLAPGQGPRAVSAGVFGATAVLLAGFLPGVASASVLLIGFLVALGALGVSAISLRAAVYMAWVVIAGYGLTAFRVEFGLTVILWLVALVVATDVMGYFAGRVIGGPKFWPRVSPKKTWSGTIAGWIGAGFVGYFFAGALGPGVVWLSVILAFASQMGDAAESALKRHTGVKDSSALIPGHGGVFDRFDALLGATFCLYLAHLAGLFGG